MQLRPFSYSEELPGSTLGDLKLPVKSYTLYCENKSEVVYVYKPEVIADTLSKADYYNENLDAQWNHENKKYFQITYTANYHFVVSMTPIDEDEV